MWDQHYKFKYPLLSCAVHLQLLSFKILCFLKIVAWLPLQPSWGSTKSIFNFCLPSLCVLVSFQYSMRIIFSLSFLRSELVITWKPAIMTINLNRVSHGQKDWEIDYRKHRFVSVKFLSYVCISVDSPKHIEIRRKKEIQSTGHGLCR